VKCSVYIYLYIWTRCIMHLLRAKHGIPYEQCRHESIENHSYIYLVAFTCMDSRTEKSTISNLMMDVHSAYMPHELL
jgi:hypothetical protein